MKPRNNNKQFPYEIIDYSIEKSYRTTGPQGPVRSETGFVILSKFWSRNDLRYHRDLKTIVGY
jgi:hypothetical protein